MCTPQLRFITQVASAAVARFTPELGKIFGFEKFALHSILLSYAFFTWVAATAVARFTSELDKYGMTTDFSAING